MKTTKAILTTLSIFLFFTFAVAQNCPGDKIKVYKGGNGCGCHCQKECVTPAELPVYLANGWNTNGCYNCCKFKNWVDSGKPKTSLDEITPNTKPGSLTVFFTLASEGDVKIQVVDLTGRYVATVINEYVEHQDNELIWDDHEINPGTYFIHMKTGDFTETKMISILN